MPNITNTTPGLIIATPEIADVAKVKYSIGLKKLQEIDSSGIVIYSIDVDGLVFSSVCYHLIIISIFISFVYNFFRILARIRH